jgi:hypothetical protein
MNGFFLKKFFTCRINYIVQGAIKIKDPHKVGIKYILCTFGNALSQRLITQCQELRGSFFPHVLDFPQVYIMYGNM